jgi:putative transposase
LSTPDVEDLAAQHGVIMTRKVIRLWMNRFGMRFAGCIKRD